MAETEKPAMSKYNSKIFYTMKKLEDFNCKKVELDTIYGKGAGTFDSNTVTVGPGAPSNGDDGSDEAWDTPFMK